MNLKKKPQKFEKKGGYNFEEFFLELKFKKIYFLVLF